MLSSLGAEIQADQPLHRLREDKGPELAGEEGASGAADEGTHLKAAIAKSVAEQFRRAGRHVTGEELSKIVDAEYTRVREQLPSEVIKEQQQERPSALPPSQAPAATPFGNLNVDWGALKTAVSSVKAPEPASQNPGYFTGVVRWNLRITFN